MLQGDAGHVEINTRLPEPIWQHLLDEAGRRDCSPGALVAKVLEWHVTEGFRARAAEPPTPFNPEDLTHG
jgi:predicted DNA-binding ribbon-helix-helix protein